MRGECKMSMGRMMAGKPETEKMGLRPHVALTAGRLLGVTAGGMMALLGLMGCDQFKEYPKNINI